MNTVNTFQKFIIKKCNIEEDDTLDSSGNFDNRFCLSLKHKQNDVKKFIKEDNIKKACCIMSYLVYKYRTQKLLDIVEYPDLVYGLYSNSDYLFVVFKGTSTIKDFITDISFIQKDDSYGIPGEIHAGFYNVIKDKFADIVEILKTNPNKKIVISGHSLGGALATVLFSYCLVNHPHLNTELYTFGSPRVGDKEFSKFISDSNKATRIINKGDIVTMIPVFDYFHYEKQYKIGNKLISCIPSIKAHSISKYIENL